MKQLIKRLKPLAIPAAVLITAWLLYQTADLFLPLDLSQDYRSIPGHENIIFERNGWYQYYKRNIWGLKKTGRLRNIESNNSHESDQSREVLISLNVTDNWIRQAVYSPDRQYILYCEIIYDYKHSETTDDEYCYYKVYDIKNGNSVTLYQGYREWYNLFWLP